MSKEFANKFKNPKIHSCEISDSFVHPNLKLSGGKCGNGESRLFISNNKEYTKQIVSKPWIIQYDKNYKNDILQYLNDNNLFRKFILVTPLTQNIKISFFNS